MWLMSERDTLPIVPLGANPALFQVATEYFSSSDELSEPASPELNGLVAEGNPQIYEKA